MRTLLAAHRSIDGRLPLPGLVVRLAAVLLVAVLAVAPVSGPKAQEAPTPAPAAPAAPATTATPAPTAPTAPPSVAAAIAEDVAADQVALDETIEQIRVELRAAVAAAPGLPSQLESAMAKAGDGGAANWLPITVLIGLATLFVGWLADHFFQRWARRRWLARLPTVPEELHQKIGYLLICALIGIVGAVVLGAVAWAINEAVHGENPHAHRTVLIMITAAVLAGAFISILRCLFAPHMPHQRVLNLDDAEAKRLTWQTSAVIVVIAIIFAINGWLHGLDISDNERDLIAIVMSAVTMLLFAWICIANRRAIADAMLAPEAWPETPFWKRWLVANWHVFVVTYFVLAWAVRSIRLLLDRPGSEGLVGAPVLIVILGLGLYGLAVLVIERSLRRMPELRGIGDGKRIADYRDLLERGAATVIVFAGIAIVLHLWGVDFIGQADYGGRVFDVLIVVFVGWLVYDAAKIWIDRKIAEEDSPTGDAGDVDSGDAPMAIGKSRLATVLPLVRFFILASIMVMVTMMALSQFGVDITPLFAGAGVIGLAIGFGSRQLVEDVISGAFYLVDDAFRVGEYIDIGKLKGTVEKISIRSFQLRHQNGPLNTVRFGEVASITNFSRDWAIMKLPLRVPLDTDSEKVRKIIKTVGQELLADPTYGPMFLDPLKSQGVYQMDDSALIIRVKFRTKPNDQFVLRRIVYARIQDAFQKAGIKFANRIVTVRVEGDPGTPEYAAARQQAIGAAALDALDSADAEAKKGA